MGMVGCGDGGWWGARMLGCGDGWVGTYQPYMLGVLMATQSRHFVANCKCLSS